MKLRYTPEALRDLQEIKRYIKSEIHNPTAANRITKAILDGCAQLKQFPEMGVSIGAKTGYETDLRIDKFIPSSLTMNSRDVGSLPPPRNKSVSQLPMMLSHSFSYSALMF